MSNHSQNRRSSPSFTLPRRDFLKLLSVTGAASALVCPTLGQSGRPNPVIRHFVPADKHLDPAWIRSLYNRGEPEIFRGKDLATIGMPVGGIGAGQLYLLGDGTLGVWQIFNRHHFSGYGDTNYQYRTWDSPVRHGFSVRAEWQGRTALRQLNKTDFPDVTFRGEYPIAWVNYARSDFPIQIEMEVFSPFIPLNARDSALPATMFQFTLTNASDAPARAQLTGALENAVCFHSAEDIDALRRSQIIREDDLSHLVHSIERAPADRQLPRREPILLADFEGADYGAWAATGKAFGAKPASGTLPAQNPVSGFLGQGLVNTFLQGDPPHGTLTSPPFKIERRFINFLIGGGSFAGGTCLNLLVDGKVLRTATGKNDEKLEWSFWRVPELEGQMAQLQIVDQQSGGWGHINVDQIELADAARGGPSGPLDKLEDFGTMTLSCVGPSSGEFEAVAYPAAEKRVYELAAAPIELGPREKKSVLFVLTWHFPNHPQGHEYNTRFKTALDVARYVLRERSRLIEQTHRWHAAFYDSTLPHWLLNRIGSTVANLATGTCQWWENGRFWAWEGVGCCHGTCTHVWNYAHAMARLFPELERSVREMQDLSVALQEDGKVSFRGEPKGNYAADGQAGTILKCYREHLLAPDRSFLERNWSKIKKALGFSLAQDANDDGLIENLQHNTYDINFFGPNTFVGALYLAALRAAEEMALELNDTAFAQRVRAVYESGRALTERNLWNGEYFIQEVDLQKHPEHQYGDGCLSDQLFGQGWAHQVGLGYIYRADFVKTALASIYRYNWAPDVGPQNKAHPPGRWFIAPGEPGLFTCTWPKSAHLEKGVLYRDEVWTGIEYQLAGHMIWEGMLDEALIILRAVHDRYHPAKHNPWNEIECGDHYARALASWGCLTALSGFKYHGPKQELEFQPRLQDPFRSCFTTAEGWGTFDQRSAASAFHCSVLCRYGKISFRQLTLHRPAGRSPAVVVQLNGQPVACDTTLAGTAVVCRFSAPITLRENDQLEIKA